MAADSLEDVLEDALVGALYARVHVSLPGRVVSYDLTTQTAAVQPIVRARFRSEDDTVETYQLPVLPAVPVAFPQGGGCSITWPLQQGDDVLLVVSERSLDEWKATAAGEVAAQDARRFDLSDAVALAETEFRAQVGDDVATVVALGLEAYGSEALERARR
jgi:hypothetical protein